MAMGLRFWHLLGVLLAAGVAVAQECDPATQVLYDPPVTILQLAPYAAITPPESCSQFQLTDLAVCQTDIGVKEGCCAQECKDVVNRVDPVCLEDLTVLGCSLEGATELVPIIDNLARRCSDEYMTITCPETAGASLLGPAAETDDETTAQSLDAGVAPPTSGSLFGEGSSSPSPSGGALFGPSSPPSSPASGGALFATSQPASPDPEVSPATATGGSECGEVDQNADIAAISGIIGDTSESTCPTLSTTEIFKCQSDITLDGDEPGCCAPECMKYLEKIGEACIEEVLLLACETNQEIQHIFQRTAHRCIEGYEKRSCDEIKNAASRPSTILAAVLGAVLLGATLLF